MQYRTDPKSGARVSALGLGCMRLPGAQRGRIDLAAAERVILRADERGVNYLDAAYSYRGVEAAVGAIFDRNPGLRDRMLVATKLPHRMCREPGDAGRILTTSLERLRTERVDYYLVHNLTSRAQWDRLVALGIEGWISDEKRAGRIGRMGFSFHGAYTDFVELLDAYDWDFCQIQYNYANETYQAGTAGLRLAAQRGLAVFVMEPLLGGKLAGGLPPAARNALRGACPDDPQRTPAAWGLRWVWNHPEVTMVLSGMNDPAQVDENAAVAATALPGSMSAGELAAVARVVEEFRRTDRVPCTGCGYCMPCPHGVNIPGCFAAYNASFALGRFTGVQQYMTASAALSDHPRLIDNCVRCGTCARRCPQGIDVPARLAEAKRRLQPPLMGPLFKLMRRRRGRG